LICNEFNRTSAVAPRIATGSSEDEIDTSKVVLHHNQGVEEKSKVKLDVGRMNASPVAVEC
jgi:hypothetical protein